MSEIVPTFLVAGAGRSGTTGLVEGLRTHPDVFITAPKEPHYFALHGLEPDFRAPGDAATINRVAVTDRAAYLSLFGAANGRAVMGDGSVSTLYYHRRSIPEILAVNPEMRVVAILRDPVERAFSAYQYMRARGFEPEEKFLDAVAREGDRIQANWHHLWHYVQMGRYAEAVEDFFDRMPSGQFAVWFYDELEADYGRTVAQVLRFIGAPEANREGVGVPRVNVSGTPRSRTAHRLIWAATRNEVIRSQVKRLTSYRLREFIRRQALRRGEVDQKTRAALEPQFRDDIASLARLLEERHPRPLPRWLAPAA